MAKRKKKRGRPLSLSDRLGAQILDLATKGLTLKQIARELGVGYSTLKAWKSRFPDFRDAIEASRDLPCELVEIAMLQRALGYRHPAVQFLVVKVGKDQEEVVAKRYTKVYPPDTTAGQFYLTNRRKKKWRHSSKVENELGERAQMTLEEIIAGSFPKAAKKP